MKKYFLVLGLMAALCTPGFAQWKPAGDRIKTSWAELVNPKNVLPEYPRPMMERKDWMNLNGEWDYAIRPKGEAIPAQMDGRILVPFAVESSLSGVQKTVGPQNELWYSRTFKVKSSWDDKKILLHFGAVDWMADVWVNDVKVGSHTGGYTAFSIDITSALKSGENQLVVRVWDPTDKGFQPRGKQVEKSRGIWYTPVTGIWQTVWMEPVNPGYIEDLKITPDVDHSVLKVKAELSNAPAQAMVSVKVLEKGKLLGVYKGIAGQEIEIRMKQPKLWTPETPYLYDLEVSLIAGSRVMDQVESYAAMRKFSYAKDKDGIWRMQLNNKDYFQFGPLDQGWWPDGLYTAPTDEALMFDIKKTKEWGFNMIRKHVKVEPQRWYTHCDRLGIIVWQDMPSGDVNPQWVRKQYFDGKELERTPESEANYRKEWKSIMDLLYSHPCIGVWVPFNEAWGQFKSCEIAQWTKTYDPSRLVNQASGGNFYPCSDIVDLHNYPGPAMYLYDSTRVNVLGEFGGIGLVLKDHLWEPNRNWGYVSFSNKEQVTAEYDKFASELQKLIQKGFSAAVYTQTTDVEIEVNGLMTYDRKEVKMDEPKIRAINQKICNSLNR